MQSRSNATIGAWTLKVAGLERARDARASFELVGARTQVRAVAAQGGAPAAAGDEVHAADGSSFVHPIEAARGWLADPARRAKLGPALVARAEASVLVAERYFLEIDQLANELAATAIADGSGDVPADDLDRIDAMVSVLTNYGVRLRELIDPDAPAPDANERLGSALAASRVGGLPALVEAL